jgi:hypothetical protein
VGHLEPPGGVGTVGAFVFDSLSPLARLIAVLVWMREPCTIATVAK